MYFKTNQKGVCKLRKKTVRVLKNFQHFFKKKKSVRDKVGGVKC